MGEANIYGDDIARVSTVLSMWNDDPGEKLMDWAGAMGYGWRGIREDAASIGTHTHTLIEDTLTLVQRGSLKFDTIEATQESMAKFMSGMVNVPKKFQKPVMLSFGAFMRWASTFAVIEPTQLEETIICDEWGLGGTCDFKGVVDYGDGTGPKRVMIDWKTSSRTSMKHKVQLAAYSLLHRWKYPDDPPFDYYGVIRFCKKTGVYEQHWTDYEDLQNDEEFFLKLLDIYHSRKLLKMF